MTQVTVDEAAAKLPALVKEVMDGNEVLITKDDQPVARLVSVKPRKFHRKFGSARGLVTIAPDFDLPVPDMDEYSR